MKDDIFETEELDTLLDGVHEKRLARGKNTRIMELVDRKTGLETAKRSRPALHISKRAAIALAACLALIVCLGVGTYAYAENAEYKEAVAYFEANDLPTEGLTRAQIKAVYRDITTESYTLDKTKELLFSSTDKVEGREIVTLDAAQTAVLNSVIASEIERLAAADVYRFGTNGRDMGSVWKVVDGKKLWTYETAELISCGPAVPVEGGNVAVFGQRKIETDGDIMVLPAVVMLSDDGEELWTTYFAEDQQYNDMIEYDSDTLVPEPDGGVTVFSVKRDYERFEYEIRVTRLDSNGGIVFDTVNPVENYWLDGAYKCDEGYIARVFLPAERVDGKYVQQTCVMRFTDDGVISGEYCFSEDGVDISIKDMAMFGGRLCVSATLTDTDKLNSAKAADGIYTAVLYLCDPDTGVLESFWQVKDAEASTLSCVKNELDWSVNRIASLERQPKDSGYSLRGTAAIWSYRFNADCELIKSVDTGEAVTILKQK